MPFFKARDLLSRRLKFDHFYITKEVFSNRKNSNIRILILESIPTMRNPPNTQIVTKYFFGLTKMWLFGGYTVKHYPHNGGAREQISVKAQITRNRVFNYMFHVYFEIFESTYTIHLYIRMKKISFYFFRFYIINYNLSLFQN